MTTKRIAVLSTAVYSLYQKQAGYVVDFIIQNLGPAGVLYFGEDAPFTASDGIQIPVNASLSKDKWRGDIYLIASATVDVRVSIQKYLEVSGIMPIEDGGFIPPDTLSPFPEPQILDYKGSWGDP